MSDRSQPAGPLIHGYHLELCDILCHPGVAAWNAKASIEEDIGAALPYLNAELKGADYYHDVKTLIWKDGGRKYALRPFEISVAPVEDREEARRLVDDTVRLVNALWERRAEIEPSFSRRTLPDLMDIYKLLPRTNCKECGYPSCLAYAAKLREETAELSQCPYLSGDASATIRNQFA
jgi:ArsR family metal-binding transcriptional regulator